MRRSGVLVLLLLTLALSIAIAACDYDATAPQSALVASSDDPAAMIRAILDASESVASLSCSFEVQAQVNLDAETLLPEDEMYLGMFQGPLTLTGTAQIDDKREAGEFDLTFGMAGITYSMGLRVLSDQVWVSMLGQWYDLSDAYYEDAASEDLDVTALRSAMAALGIDPVDWLGEIDLLGEETLNGDPVFHLSCKPDVSLVLDDFFLMMNDDDFMLTIDPAGDLLESLFEDTLSESDLRDMRAELPGMIDGLTLNLWAGKDDSLLRRLDLSFNLTAPPEESEGLESIEAHIQLDFDGFGEPVTVEAPENALPFSQFMQMFGSDFPLPIDDTPEEPTRS